MIVLNYPNNPTGKILSRTITKSNYRMLQKNMNCYILSDEIYSNYSNEERGRVFYHTIMKNQLLHNHFQNHTQ